MKDDGALDVSVIRLVGVDSELATPDEGELREAADDGVWPDTDEEIAPEAAEDAESGVEAVEAWAEVAIGTTGTETGVEESELPVEGAGAVLA